MNIIILTDQHIERSDSVYSIEMLYCRKTMVLFKYSDMGSYYESLSAYAFEHMLFIYSLTLVE